MIIFTQKDGAIIFKVKVLPRSSKSEIVGEFGGALKIKLNSPPVDGAANAELVRLLSRIFDVSKSEIEIIGGQTSKLKKIKITNFSAAEFIKVLD